MDEKKDGAKKNPMASFKDPSFKQTLSRLVKMLFKFYPWQIVVVLITSIISVVISVMPAVFMQKALTIIQNTWEKGDWQAAQGPLTKLVIVLITLYVIGLASSFIYTQLMAIITQGSLMKIRNKMFHSMEKLPVRYFDSQDFGDIMSHYTNDVDALRQLISSSLLQLITGTLVILGVMGVMFYYSLWMTIVVLVGVALMFSLTAGLGSRAAGYFKAQQKSLGVAEGFIEEAMTGQKTIKVYTHEAQSSAAFREKNDELFQASRAANRYANVIAPILFNTGNIVYVFVAVIGGALLFYNVDNVSISGMALTIATVIPFLNMTKQFTGQISSVARTVNALILGSAGAKRVFELIDGTPEIDDGKVGLVPGRVQDNNLEPCGEGDSFWAWKKEDDQGNISYRPLCGDIVLNHVDFGYTEDHLVLKDLSLYAKPGQKVAFVGSTGAGKTTITNLINRFYEIDSGEILYDGINIQDIKKADLRKSLGMVLQETNLFSDTVMENIRFGNLEATDEQCIAAARLAGADQFIRRLPEGYNTRLRGNGSNLSQGQRQLLSIARAAVADPPVMILDEATSSIDTRTEALVQMGMDALMNGRTTFVIAHRLSTVRNADVICVLEQGRIIERGSHQDLMDKKGTYYQLYTGAFELE